MRNLMLVCIGLVLMSGIVSVNLWRELRHERQLNAELQMQSADRGTRGSSRGLPVSPVALAPAPGTPTNQASAPSSSPQGSEDAAAADSRVSASRREQLNDPAYRTAFLAQARLKMARTYPGLIEQLGLSPEEADKLYAVLAERELDMRGVSLLVEGLPEEAGREARENAIAEINRKRDESLATLLGSDRLVKFETYQQDQPGWTRVTELNQTLAALGVPLNADQSKPLATLLASELGRQRNELQSMFGNPMPADPADQARMLDAFIESQTQSNRRILESANSYLSARQLETLKSSLEQQLAQARAEASMRRAQAAQGH